MIVAMQCEAILSADVYATGACGLVGDYMQVNYILSATHITLNESDASESIT